MKEYLIDRKFFQKDKNEKNCYRKDKGYEKIPSSEKDLNILVKDTGIIRNVRIEGKHVIPGGLYDAKFSELKTELSVATLKIIALAKGRHFRDEIERSENPDYVYKNIKNLIDGFDIDLSEKKILDFGCGAGAFGLNLRRLGGNEIIGVDVDERLLEIAQSRISDFYDNGSIFKKIEFVNEKHGLPFSSESFDIVWPHAVIEHVLPGDRQHVLRELWRVLKKNGLLIIDATPNRLWPKEHHTTGLFFLNYLPLNVSCYLARKFSIRVPESQSVQNLLSRGIRGCTYWEISKRLQGSVCLNYISRKKDLDVFMQGWVNKTDSATKKYIKKLYKLIMSSIDPILRIMKVPQTAFLPSHIMVFEKKGKINP
ncbi:MAG: class I SAM-dependent methyltransferase [Candidatus Scalinduaceae bacterium]